MTRPRPRRASDLVVADQFARGAGAHPDRLAVIGPDRSYTFAGLDRRAAALAGGLARSGVASGDRVALLAANCSDYIPVFGACARLGAVLVPLNVRLTAPELRGIMVDCQARVLVVQEAFAEAAAESTRGLATHIVGFGELEGAPDASDAEVAEADLAALMYTAAVDGTARGAMMSHRSFVYQAHNQASAIGIRPDDLFIVLTPLFHTAALSYALSFLAAGAGCVLTERFDPAEAARLIAEYRVTVVFGFAPMQGRLIDAAEEGGHDLSSVRVLLGRDAPEVIRRYLTLGPDVRWLTGNFGQTETQGMAVAGELVNLARLSEPGFVPPGGRETPFTRVRLVDEAGREVPRGSVGEFVVRGPVVADGYWRRREATERALRGGWWHTGDLGRADADGALRFVGRLDEKELIKTGGENVYPVEVEQALRSHQAVAEVAVIGVPDPRWSEAVKAIIVRRDGAQVEALELVEFCRTRIAGYKKPRIVEFVDSLPMTAAGAVDRAEVKRRYGA